MFSRNRIVYFLKDKQLEMNIINTCGSFFWSLIRVPTSHPHASVGFKKHLQMTNRWPFWVAVLSSED